MPAIYHSIVRWRLFLFGSSDIRGGQTLQMLRYEYDIPLHFIDIQLLTGYHVIKLLDGIFVVHQLDLDIGNPLVHE